ncbi:MAG: nicotinamide mononucleotide transporter [Bacteroidales bacterium]|nr:nicotinamide mononucleotide transporter [Bacteroidales bacterium]
MITTGLLDWLKDNYIELCGTILSLIYLYYSVKQNILLWPFGILSSAIYVYIYFVAKIYADMGLNIYYVLISIYGWIIWARGKNPDTPLEISKVSQKQIIYLSIIGLTLFIFFIFLLTTFTDSPVPNIDAFTTAASIIATWMLARKIIEHWILWIVIDVISMGLYYYRGLYITIILFFVYTVISVTGFLNWRKEYAKLNQNL